MSVSKQSFFLCSYNPFWGFVVNTIIFLNKKNLFYIALDFQKLFFPL